MSEFIDKIGQSLFPQSIRCFLTLRLMAGVVIVLMIPALILRLTVRLPAEVLSVYQEAEHLILSPWFLVPFNLVIVLGFCLIFSARQKPQYHWIRALTFGMLFAGVIGELLIILVPWRT